MAGLTFRSPTQDLETLADWGTEHLTRIIAQDSQSDEESPSIPSTEGQRTLSADLRTFFADLGYDGRTDDYGNTVVRVPSNLPEGERRPTLALMCHIDTSKGTLAVPSLEVAPAWDGSPIPYPDNDRLQVSAERYASVRPFLGEDVLYGPGAAPIGLDDKLGIAEVMTLGRVLAANPDIARGELRFVFRPDEEIGRMAAVVGLAQTLLDEGVSHGYTVDGIEPFEINVENFNASRVHVTVPDEPLGLPEVGCARHVSLAVIGVKSHGATARAEGYLNATVVVARALQRLGARSDLFVTGFRSDPLAETNAQVDLLLCGETNGALDSTQAELVAALEAVLEPHGWRGAGLEVTHAVPVALDEPEGRGGAMRAVEHVASFLATPGPTPVLSEDSDGYQGYTNPHFITPLADGYEIRYRVRDFDPDALQRREAHVLGVCAAATPPLVGEARAQYINMGPQMKPFPELDTWASAALEAIGQPVVRRPIRGGTGVDPFLDKGIPVANLGTGYFAPESEKELTSRQNIARHALWLVHLVQAVAPVGG